MFEICCFVCHDDTLLQMGDTVQPDVRWHPYKFFSTYSKEVIDKLLTCYKWVTATFKNTLWVLFSFDLLYVQCAWKQRAQKERKFLTIQMLGFWEIKGRRVRKQSTELEERDSI